MKFLGTQVKAVKADLAKKEITLTFVVDLRDQEQAEQLAHYVGDEDAGDVDLEVTPRQLALFEPAAGEEPEKEGEA